MGIQTGLVSNTDARMGASTIKCVAFAHQLITFELKVAALEDLDTLNHLDPVLISEAETVEKPEKEIFARACDRAGMKLYEAVHVGDELDRCVADSISCSILPGALTQRLRQKPSVTIMAQLAQDCRLFCFGDLGRMVKVNGRNQMTI
jgi:histidinol phosphatase-like enzyme